MQVYQRQLAKQGLSTAIVDANEDADAAAEATTRTFSREELRELFKVTRCMRACMQVRKRASCGGWHPLLACGAWWSAHVLAGSPVKVRPSACM